MVRVVGDEHVAGVELAVEELEAEAHRQRRRLSMNCGMPTDSAARRPCPSRIVALRSLLWLRIGVVAVRDTNVAISKQIVSIAERITSAVTGIDPAGCLHFRPSND